MISQQIISSSSFEWPRRHPTRATKAIKEKCKIFLGIRNNSSQWHSNRWYLIVPYDRTVHSNSEQTA